MQVRRFVFASLLFTGCCLLPGTWAPGGGRASAQDEKPVTKADLEETDKAVANLKKALDKAQKELDATKKSLDTMKAATADAKTAAKKAADLKGEVDAMAKKTAALEAALAKVKTDGGTTEKLAALEKAAEESKKEAEKAAEESKKAAEDLKKAADQGVTDAGSATGDAKARGDTAWILTSSAFVMLMVPGLALFYGGMVRRKNVLATMMHSMGALAVVGVYWVAVGYALAFGPSVINPDLFGIEKAGLIGWSWDLFFLQGIEPAKTLPGYDIPVYLHVMFQGMFAIITPALISGAIAERIRFWPFCLFMILWVTFVYCPLAHMVWAFDWFDTTVVAAKRGGAAIGLLGKMGALDFAGGTVVHIAAGMAGLACCLVLGKRHGYPQQIAHPNSLVLTLLGAGLLWFGWFGFNGGSSLNSTSLSVSAFAATQVAAAAAGLGWMLIEWIHKGKPTALGLASGIVAGLVAVTPASGFVYMWGALFIGLAAAVLCYLAVALKNVLGYDDSLDAFGVHGVGGFVGAVLTGVFCSTMVNPAGTDGVFSYSAHRSRLEALNKDDGKMIKDAEAEAAKAAADAGVADATAEAKDTATDKATTADKLKKERESLQALVDKQDDKEHEGKDKKSRMSQLMIQIKAAVFSVVFAFVLSIGLVFLVQAITLGNFKTDDKGEAQGLDRTEHGEVGFDFSNATESANVVNAEPRAATMPRGNGRFDLQLTGAEAPELMGAWTELCQPTAGPPDKDFLAVYPHVTTIRGTTFRCRGGDPAEIKKRLEALFTRLTGKGITATKV